MPRQVAIDEPEMHIFGGLGGLSGDGVQLPQAIGDGLHDARISPRGPWRSAQQAVQRLEAANENVHRYFRQQLLQ